METREQDARDEVLALKELLKQMLQEGQDEEVVFPPVTPQKGVIRNDRLLELIGVAPSELSPSEDSVYSPEGSLEAAVAPLHRSSPLEQKEPCHPVSMDCQGDTDESLSSTDDDKSAVTYGCIELPVEDNPRRGTCPAGIRTSKTSEKLLRQSATFEPDFQIRMKQFTLKNQLKQEALRQSLVVKEEGGVMPMPHINRRSKHIPRSVSHLVAWQHEKESKLACMRDATAIQEKSCVSKPSISSRSLSMFTKRKDDVALCKVEDRLHLLGLIYQYQQEERKRSAEEGATTGGPPRLAPHSVNIQRRRKLSVHERLYQLSKRDARSKNCNHRKPHPDKAVQTKCDQQVNDGGFADTVQRLYGMNTKYKQKQVLLNQKREQYFDNLRREPKMSARSRKLAAKRKQNPAPKSPLRCGCCGGKENLEGFCGCTVQSRVSKKHAADIYERHLRWKQGKNAKHIQQRQLQETMVMLECTFRNPLYQKAWDTLDDDIGKLGNDGHKASGSVFYKRCMAWAEKRDRRLACKKKAAQEQQLQECTFRPRISRRPASKHRVSNQLDASRRSSVDCFLDCSSVSSSEGLVASTDDLISQLYSALDLKTLAGELSPTHMIADDEDVHGYPKHTFTDFGEFAGR